MTKQQKIEAVLAICNYDATTGRFNSKQTGDDLKRQNKTTGYWLVRVKDELGQAWDVYCHHVIWAIEHGSEFTERISFVGSKDDLRLDNLCLLANSKKKKTRIKLGIVGFRVDL